MTNITDQKKSMDELVEIIHAASIVKTTDVACVGRALKETHHSFWAFVEKEARENRHPSEALYGIIAASALFARSMVVALSKAGEEEAMLQTCIQTYSTFLSKIEEEAATLTKEVKMKEKPNG